MKIGIPLTIIDEQVRFHLLKLKTPQEIGNKLAESFANTSSNNNFSPQFLEYKQTFAESTPTFDNSNDQFYNRKFTYIEIKHALSRSNDSSPGDDMISYSILTH